LFDDINDNNNAETVHLSIGEKDIVLEAMKKNGDSDTYTPRGIFRPQKILQVSIKSCPWPMANAVCIKKVLSSYCTFSDNNFTIIQDRDGFFYGEIAIIADSFTKIPPNIIRTKCLDEDGSCPDETVFNCCVIFLVF